MNNNSIAEELEKIELRVKELRAELKLEVGDYIIATGQDSDYYREGWFGKIRYIDRSGDPWVDFCYCGQSPLMHDSACILRTNFRPATSEEIALATKPRTPEVGDVWRTSYGGLYLVVRCNGKPRWMTLEGLSSMGDYSVVNEVEESNTHSTDTYLGKFSDVFTLIK